MPRRHLRTAAALAATTVLATAGTAVPALSAQAAGGHVGGSGASYYLNDSNSGTANRQLSYGEPGDQVFVGDWDGNGTDTLAVRRGNQFHIRNSLSSGVADLVISYGDAPDTILVGDWDGNGTDTLAVRRGNQFHIRNSLTTGAADTVVHYGDVGDDVIVGDWDGNRTDTLAVRRGNQFHIRNTLTSGVANSVVHYGNVGDALVVGQWNGRSTGLGVRRGNTYFLKNDLRSGEASTVFSYGNVDDTTLVGDWNGDGRATLGVRRDDRPAADGFAAGLVAEVNAQRAAHGLRPLVGNACAAGYSQRWADHLATTGAFAHQDVRAVMNGCQANRAAENIARGHQTPQAMVQAWMQSPGHRANILDGRLTSLGSSVARGADGRVTAVHVFLG